MFKKKSIFITLVLAIVLVFSLSINSFASENIKINGTSLESGKYLACDGITISDTQPEGGYAFFKDGVLTLSNFNLTSNEQYTILAEESIKLELIGNNSLTNTHIYSGSLDVPYALCCTESLEISGTGSLSINMESTLAEGIFVHDEFALKEATLDINCPGEKSYCLDLGSLTLNSGSIYVKAGATGLDAFEKITFNDGLIKAEGKNGVAIDSYYGSIELAKGTLIKAGNSWDCLENYREFNDTVYDSKCVEIKIEPEEEPDIPATADTNDILPYVCTGLAAFLLLGFVIRRMRRKQ